VMLRSRLWPFGNARKRPFRDSPFLGGHFDRLPGRQPAQIPATTPASVSAPTGWTQPYRRQQRHRISHHVLYLRSFGHSAERLRALFHVQQYVIAKYTTPYCPQNGPRGPNRMVPGPMPSFHRPRRGPQPQPRCPYFASQRRAEAGPPMRRSASAQQARTPPIPPRRRRRQARRAPARIDPDPSGQRNRAKVAQPVVRATRTTAYRSGVRVSPQRIVGRRIQPP